MTTSAGLATARPEDLAAAGPAGARAAIVVVCREPGAREIPGRELSKRYGADYQIVVCDRPAELETRMRDLLAARLPGHPLVDVSLKLPAFGRSRITAVRWRWRILRSPASELESLDHSRALAPPFLDLVEMAE